MSQFALLLAGRLEGLLGDGSTGDIAQLLTNKQRTRSRELFETPSEYPAPSQATLLIVGGPGARNQTYRSWFALEL